MPGTIAEHLVAVLREALSNAARHAGAHRVDVELCVGDDVQLSVRGDGRGTTTGDSRLSGLANVAERAAQVGGACEVAPSRGRYRSALGSATRLTTASALVTRRGRPCASPVVTRSRGGRRCACR